MLLTYPKVICPVCFFATDVDGRKYRWSYWRDALKPHSWMLRDHTGYTRTLESNWRESVPRILAILKNHGLKANIS